MVLGTPLLERDAERRALLELASGAAAGRGGFGHVTGAPGLGKTALLRDLADAAGLTVLWATAGELESKAPFGVVRRLLGRPVMGLPEESRARVARGPARLAVDHLLGSATGPAEQAAMFHSLYWLVDALAATKPLLVVVDDAQWADEESLLFLAHLATDLGDLPLLLTVGVRDVQPDRRSSALATLLANRQAAALRLRPLSTDAVAKLLRTTDADVARRAGDLTGGNPFLAVALAELLAADPDADLDALVPDTVVASVTQRLAVLPTPDRDLARALAVLVRAPARVAAIVAGLTRQAADESADRLRNAGLLAETADLAFRHALLQSAVLSATGPGATDTLRRRAATTLAVEPGGLHQAAAQLVLLDGAADPAAVEILRRAAADALRAASPRTAVDLLTRAIAEPPTRDRLPDVLLALGDAQLHAADPACLQTLQQAFGATEDPVARAHAALGLAAAWNMVGAAPEAVDALAPALERLDESHGDLALIIEGTLLGAARQVPERILEARERLAARSGLTGATAGERLFLAAQVFDAVGVNSPGTEVIRMARLVLEGPVSSGAHAHAERHGRNITRLAFCAAGFLDEGIVVADAAIAQGYAEGSPWEVLAGYYARGLLRHRGGDLGGAEADLRAMLEIASTASDLGRRLGTAGLIDVLVDRGDLDTAAEVAKGTSDADLTATGYSGSTPLLRALAGLALAQEAPTRALALAEECGLQSQAMAYDAPGWCSWRSVAVPALWRLDRIEEAVTQAKEELALLTPTGSVPALGAALRLLGEVTGDEALLAEAVEVLAPTSARLEHARALVALGSLIRRDGRTASAREHLAAGRELAARCGAMPLADLAGVELAAAGSRPRRLEVTGLGALTASERRVCELAARGFSNRQIAQQLFVAPKTVETHLSRAFRKLAVSGRQELAQVLPSPR